MREPIDFEISGLKYRATPMDAIAQFHVARRLAPLLPALQGLSASGDKEAVSSLSVFSDVLSKMPEADLNYILGACLATVHRQKPGDTGWAKIWGDQSKSLMFTDIGMPEMMMIAVQVIGGNLANFTNGLLPTSSGGAVPASPSIQ